MRLPCVIPGAAVHRRLARKRARGEPFTELEMLLDLDFDLAYYGLRKPPPVQKAASRWGCGHTVARRILKEFAESGAQEIERGVE